MATAPNASHMQLANHVRPVASTENMVGSADSGFAIQM